MKRAPNPQVVRRFIVLMAVATFVMFSFWALVKNFNSDPPGDFEVREGDIRLGNGRYEKALERFTAALGIMPNHRGALMGRALAYLQTARNTEAEAEFTYLIDYLKKSLEADDITGFALHAAAHTNRGILYDRTGRYEKALADYIAALKIDEEALRGPNLLEKVIYGTPRPALVRGRAIYLQKQLALPEDQRLMRVPEKDADQRMYKPF